MNQKLALKTLSQIMSWTDAEAEREFRWLSVMAQMKYDTYRDFQAGMRFLESLSAWLQQFEPQDRSVAYEFVRSELVYIGTHEFQHLVECFYPCNVHKKLVELVSERNSIPRYMVHTNKDSIREIVRLRRQTLFMGLSDGARLDRVRHANYGTLSNEQFVSTVQIDTDKWNDLLGKLQSSLNDSDASFRLIYLIDDFTASGTSIIRKEDGEWAGKLVRFKDSIDKATQVFSSLLAKDWKLNIHHYVASTQAVCTLASRLQEAHKCFSRDPKWSSIVSTSYGTILPPGLRIDQHNRKTEKFIALAKKYYDPDLRTQFTDMGGVENIALGFAGCALPVILEHNSPNNSVAFLWGQTEGANQAHAMRPLFRRRQRHY